MDSEVRQLVAASNEPVRTIIILATMTGLRIGAKRRTIHSGDQLQGASPMEEVSLDTARSRSARDLGRQTSTASTGRRGLAWADSLG